MSEVDTRQSETTRRGIAEVFRQSLPEAMQPYQSAVPERSRQNGFFVRLFGDREDRLHEEAEKQIENATKEGLLGQQSLGIIAATHFDVAATTEDGWEQTVNKFSKSEFVMGTAGMYLGGARGHLTSGLGSIQNSVTRRITRAIERR